MKSNRTFLQRCGILIIAAAASAAVLLSCSAVRADPVSGENASSLSGDPSSAASEPSGFYRAFSSPAAAASESSAPASSASDGVRYYFPRAGQKAQPVLIGIIGSAKKTLDVAIYSFTDKEIAAALVNAKKRGVAVRVITDRTQSETRSQKTVLKQVVSAGIPVKVDTHEGIMHLKVTVADGKTATTGSFNYTQAAENSNDEVFVVIDSSKVAQDFDREFSSMWNDAGNFKKYS